MDFVSLAQADKINDNIGAQLTYNPQAFLDFPPWENDFGKSTAHVPFQPSHSSSQSTINIIPGQGNEILVQVSGDASDKTPEFGNHSHTQGEWQVLNDLKHQKHILYVILWNMYTRLSAVVVYYLYVSFVCIGNWNLFRIFVSILC